MLVIAMETGVPPGGRARWSGRRHDDEEADSSYGVSPADLFDHVFRALHDGEQVALGLDCPLSVTLFGNQRDAAVLAELAESAAWPGLAELGHLFGELGRWRPWTRVSTSLARWRANTSILVWQAGTAPGSSGVTASAAVGSFFRQLPVARARATDEDAGAVVNLAAAAARRARLFVDPSELSRPPVTITVTSG